MLRDGTGVVVKRGRPVPLEGTLRLLSTHPGHPDVSRDCHILGEVLWKVTSA